MRRSAIGQMTVIVAAGSIFAALAVAMAIMMAYNKPIFAVLGALTAAGGVLALSSNVAALCLLVAVACVDGILKGMFPGLLAIAVKDILIGLMTVRWLWEGLNGAPRPSLSQPIALPVFLFAVYCVAQMFNSETGSVLVALAGLRSWVGALPLFFVIYDTFATERAARAAGWFAVCVVSLTSIYGAVQQRIGFGHLYALSSGFDFYRKFGEGGTLRAASTFVAPGVFGLTANLAILLAVGLGLSARNKATGLLVGSLGAIVCFVGVASSGSRAPLAGAVFGLAVFAVLSRRPQMLLVLVILALLAAWQSENYFQELLANRWNQEKLGPDALANRALSPFLSGWDAMVANPLGTGVASGVGLGRAGSFVGEESLMVTSSAASFIENELGRAMKELGFPGAFLFLWLLWRALTGAFRGWRLATGDARWMAGGALATVAAAVPALAVGQALYIGAPAVLFWFACAIACRSPQYAEQAEQAWRDRSEVDSRTAEEMAEWEKLQRRAGLAGTGAGLRRA